MLQSLEIENFRQFSHFTIPELGRINLLTGKNNSGKTSILEAIHLLMANDHPAQVMTQLQAIRGEITPTSDSHKYASEIINLFYQRELNFDHVLKITGFRDHDLRKLIMQIVSDRQSSNQIFTFDGLSGKNQDLQSLKILIERQAPEIDNPKYVGTLGDDQTILFEGDAYLKRSISRFQGSDFLTRTSLSAQEAAYLYSNLVLTPAEDWVLEAANIIDPGIQRIAPKYPEIEKIGLIPKQGFFAKLAGNKNAISLANMGDGLWCALSIILAVANAKGKILLIDEIDIGLHYSVMTDLWKLIWKTAEELDIQVFATTHSRDCWEALAALVEQEEATSKEIMLHHISALKGQSISFTGNQLSIAAERELEVR
jgi:AAA15 family ATPase/GTPase